jgi:hypothetical protein
MTPTPEQCIERYLKLRNAKAEREAKAEAEIKEYDDAMEAIENYLLSVMLERKEVQIKTAHGTAFQSPQMRAKLVDRAALVDYVKRTGDFNLFTNAVAKEAVTAYAEANKAPPPGVEITRFVAVNVRKA